MNEYLYKTELAETFLILQGESVPTSTWSYLSWSLLKLQLLPPKIGGLILLI